MTFRSFILRSFSAILLFSATLISCDEDEQPQQAPVINSYSPESGFSGAVVTISGENFGNKVGNVKVYFHSGAEAEVTEVTNTSIKVVVPGNAYVGPVTVRVKKMETEGTDFTVLTMCHYGGEVFLPCNKELIEGPK